MTDKEKIRAEIESRYKENKADGYTDVCEELRDLLSFIDSMQEEPVSDEEKMTDIQQYVGIQTKPIGEDNVEDAALIIANCYGKQWQPAVHGFILGARWQKEQMMKDAIDGIVHPDDKEIWCDINKYHLEDGDKVKVIIIKNDGKI